MICSYFVEPGGNRPRCVVWIQLVPNLHENVHRRVCRIFPGRKRPAAKTKNRRSVLPVEVAPSLGIPCPGPSDDCARLPCFRRVHPAWFLDVHRLVRTRTEKITLRWHRPVPVQLYACGIATPGLYHIPPGTS